VGKTNIVAPGDGTNIVVTGHLPTTVTDWHIFGDRAAGNFKLLVLLALLALKPGTHYPFDIFDTREHG